MSDLSAAQFAERHRPALAAFFDAIYPDGHRYRAHMFGALDGGFANFDCTIVVTDGDAVAGLLLATPRPIFHPDGRFVFFLTAPGIDTGHAAGLLDLAAAAAAERGVRRLYATFVTDQEDEVAFYRAIGFRPRLSIARFAGPTDPPLPALPPGIGIERYTGDPDHDAALAALFNDTLRGQEVWVDVDVAGLHVVIATPGSILLVARRLDSGEPVAFCEASATWASIISIGVRPDMRSTGLSDHVLVSALHALAATGAAQAGSLVRHDNPASMALHRRCGLLRQEADQLLMERPPVPAQVTA